MEIESSAGKITVSNHSINMMTGISTECYLDGPQSITTPLGIFMAAGRLNFYDTGELMVCLLEKEEMVCTPAGDFMVEALSFYKNGMLKGFGVKNARVFNMKSGNFPGRDIILYSTGCIRVIFNGDEVYYFDKEGKQVDELDPDEADETVSAAEAESVEEFNNAWNNFVTELADKLTDKSEGNVYDGSQADSFDEFCMQELQQVMRSKGDEISIPGVSESLMVNKGSTKYYLNKKIKECILMLSHGSVATPAGDLTLKGPLKFYRNGAMMECSVSDPSRIKTPSGEMIVIDTLEFFKDGSLSSCRINEPVSAGGKNYRKGDTVAWDKKGRLV